MKRCCMQWLICNHKWNTQLDLEEFLDISVCMKRQKNQKYCRKYQEIHNMYGYYLYIISRKVTFFVATSKWYYFLFWVFCWAKRKNIFVLCRLTGRGINDLLPRNMESKWKRTRYNNQAKNEYSYLMIRTFFARISKLQIH